MGIRCFLAFPISDHFKNELKRILKVLGSLDLDVKWVEVHNLHLTLKFIESFEENRLNEFIALVGKSLYSSKAFNVSLTEVGAFPHINHPQIIWVGLSDSEGQMAVIAQNIENELKSLGIPKENRQFRPHITIGRVKSNRNLVKLIEALKSLKVEDRCTEVFDRIVLYKSILSHQGPIYETIKEFGIPK